METKSSSSLGETLRNGSLYERAPSHLRAEVLAQVRQAQEKKRRTGWHWPLRGAGLTFAGGGLAGIALCSLMFATVLWMQPVVRSHDVAQEIVASHVRALMSSRDIDVMSTDQHTVKPWFNGRIDYAPPVVDLAAQGFPLVGGRLDYVDHRAVAVMIYRYLKHPIDLYVFPDASGKAEAGTVKTQTEDGYSLVEWHKNGMTYWAISDASAEYLKRFVEAIRG
jgi:anti-sigma factor RsiW